MTGIGESVRFFFWLGLSALEFLVYYWPISVAVLASAVAALTVRSPLHDPRFRGRLRLLTLTYAIPPVILLIGTLLRYELHGPPHPNWREPPAWYGYLLWAVVIFHVAVLMGSLVAMRGTRLRAAGVLLPGVWLSVCAFIPAGFSVVGVGP